MKRFVLTTALILSLCVTARSQTGASNPEVMNFELSPVAPPTPALKYQLLFDGAFDRLPGNAAPLYLDSVLLMGPDAADKADKALDAYNARNMTRFNSLADSLENRSLMEELDQAGRREDCNWESPFREMGLGTLLPHLNSIRVLSKILKVRALREIEQGKVDDALNTMRLGYEMSDKAGQEPCIISGLVSLSMTSMMDDCLKELMNRPDAPNLYWALSGFPSRRSILSTSLNGESQDWVNGVPNLAQAWRGEDLSAQQWRSVFDYYISSVSGWAHPMNPDVVGATSPELMQQAREQYAQTHHVTPEQAAGVDPLIVVGTFYLSQFEIARDNLFKLRELTYPMQMVLIRKYSDENTRLLREQPANPFLQLLSSFQKGFWRFARVDRELTALTAVEAIRSYAAESGGELPAQLSDITDTPIPLNPATGEPFEYRVDNGTATLSDSKSEGRLTYTIRIRK
jgi:hypothetical protein